MRALTMTFALAAAILLTAASGWTSQAVAASGAAKLGVTAQQVNPLKPAACRGRGAHCPPGFIWNGRRCVPC